MKKYLSCLVCFMLVYGFAYADNFVPSRITFQSLATSSQINTNLTKLETLINGNLDNGNIDNYSLTADELENNIISSLSIFDRLVNDHTIEINKAYGTGVGENLDKTGSWFNSLYPIYYRLKGLDLNANSTQFDTTSNPGRLDLAEDGITASLLNSDVCGTGLSQNVDGSIMINADTRYFSFIGDTITLVNSITLDGTSYVNLSEAVQSDTADVLETQDTSSITSAVNSVYNSWVYVTPTIAINQTSGGADTQRIDASSIVAYPSELRNPKFALVSLYVTIVDVTSVPSNAYCALYDKSWTTPIYSGGSPYIPSSKCYGFVFASESQLGGSAPTVSGRMTTQNHVIIEAKLDDDGGFDASFELSSGCSLNVTILAYR